MWTNQRKIIGIALFWLCFFSLNLAESDTATGQTNTQTAATSQAAEQRKEVAASQPVSTRVDPFTQLFVVTPKNKLPPLVSVRLRDTKDTEERGKNISINVGSSPSGAAVYFGGKLLGQTPLTLSAKKGSTPLDIVVRVSGYMTLHTRLWRIESRSYFFKLTPAKIR